MHITSLSASPSEQSRSTWLTRFALTRLEGRGAQHDEILIRTLPPAALLQADVQDPAIRAAVQAVEQADLVVIGTPIYKAAYSGLLKVFLDLLPPDALRGKLVLPLATGGSPAHFLALDYALKPVLSALGARHVLDGVFATDAQLRRVDTSGHASRFIPEPDLIARLDRALSPLTEPTERMRPLRPTAEPALSC
ncbi:NADPH-dependent FMN reductase [Roseateles sp. BYS87W]|uniref:NADPH-dependent FMN reductase n=1 Tax=Pelomonas baiyunensis TaxID=3299026 RepID=A0ABW7GV65_9BURK